MTKNSAPVRVTTVTVNGRKEWRLNGKVHREDGPAVEFADGSKWWFRHDFQHREDGPALENADGSKEWWVNGQKHREDGPAVINQDGSEEWWIVGKQLSGDESKAMQEHIQQQKAVELRNALTEVLTKGFEKDLIAPTTARFKPKVRP